MKRSIIFCLLLSVYTGYAQQAPGLYDAKLAPEVRAILVQQAAAANKGAKAAATTPRVMAHAEFYTGVGTDSFVYAYSGLRGSGKILTALRPYTAFSINGDAFVNADTQTRYGTPQSQPNAALVYRYRDYFTYDAANRIITATQFGGTTFYKFSYTYNAAGNATQALTLGSATLTGTYTPAAIEFFQYNAQNKLVYDSLGFLPSGQPNIKMYSYYDAGNRLTGTGRYGWVTSTNSWKLVDSFMYTYYANNLLKTSVRTQFYSTVTANRDSFGYSGSNPLPIYTLSSNGTSATGPWATQTQEVNVLNAAGDNYTTRLLSDYTGSAFVPNTKTYGIFNADGSIRRGEYYHFATGSQDAVPFYTLNYYYQQSIAPAAVSAEKADKVLVIYPNPADNYITIDFSGLHGQNTAAGYRINITDVSGRQVISRQCTAGSSDKVDVSRLSAGWYSMNVLNAGGEVVKAGGFVKR